MKITLKRKYHADSYTIGDLFIDGTFFCNTIEDRIRQLPQVCPNTPKGMNCTCKEKIYAETAIPSGTYKVTMSYSPKFKRVLPLLHNVPHFIGILIHSGTDENSSAGCIIVGMNKVKGKVVDSRKTSDALNEILSKEKEIIITIQ